MCRGESALVYHNIFVSGKDNVLLKTCDLFIKSRGVGRKLQKGCSGPLTMHFIFLSYFAI